MSAVAGGRPTYTQLQRLVILASAGLGFSLDLYNVLIVPYTTTGLERDFNISLGQVGWVTTVTLLGSVLGGVMFGWVGDRRGRRVSLQLAIFLFAAGAALTALAWNYPSLLGIRFITGVGLGGEWGAGMVLFNEAWDRRRSFGGALIQGCSVPGGLAAVFVGTWAMSSFSVNTGWRIATLLGASPIVLVIVIRLLMPESQAWSDASRATVREGGMLSSSPIAQLFSRSHIGMTLKTMFWLSAYMFFFYGITTYMPSMILSQGASESELRLISVIMQLVSGAGYLVVGWCGEHLRRRTSVLWPALFWVATLVGLYFTGGGYHSMLRWPLFWVYSAFMIGAVSLGVTGVWLSELFPIGLRATGTSAAYVVGRGIGALAPVAVISLATAVGGELRIGMMATIPALAVFVAISLVLPDRSRENLAEPQTEPATLGRAVPSRDMSAGME